MQIKKTVVGLGAAVLALGLAACDPSDLTSVNRNPNDPTDAPTTTLFTNATRNAVARWMNGVGGTRYGFLPQHLAEVQYPESDAYLRIRGSNTAALFDGSYNVELQDFQLVINRGLESNEAGTYAPAMTMKSWEVGILTDAWGDIPYSQAFRADSGILLPAYDTQEAIYADLFVTLAKASTDLTSATNELGSADPIYAGNPQGWQKFANSLRARHALRLVNVDRATASAQLQAAFAAPGGVILTNADNARLVWPGDGVYDNPWAANFLGRDDHRISDNLLLTLQSTNDPRVYVLAQRAENDAPEIAGVTEKWCPDATTPCFVGVANALTHPAASPNMPTTSRLGAIWYPGATTYGTFGGNGAKYPSYLMTAAEMHFVRAEAAERGLGGLTAASAATEYMAGIRANMEMLGVSQAAITAYLAQPSVIYAGGTAGLQQIAQEKWLALIIDPMNAWSELRRTCAPAFVEPGPQAITTVLPRRFYYSTGERGTNGTNLQAAIDSQGADNFNTRIYWDTAPTAAPTYTAGCNTR